MNLTATQLIYAGWKKTGNPVSYETRDALGNDIRADAVFLPPRMAKGWDGGLAGTCCVCGGEARGGIRTADMLTDKYTDWGRMKADSGIVCEACAFCMLLNMRAGRCALFRYSFAANADGLRLLNRRQIREALIEPPEPPFVMVATVSQKKHLATKAILSYSRDKYACLLEEEMIWVDRGEMIQMLRILEAMRAMGATKAELLRNQYRYDHVRAWGFVETEAAQTRIAPYVDTRQYALAVFAAGEGMDKEEARCYLDFRPTM